MVDVVVTLAAKFAEAGSEVAQILSEDGLIVDRVYPFGVITGRANAHDLSRLRNHLEVEEIREDRKFKISPPDSDVQ